MVPQKHSDSVVRSAALTIPELEQSKAAVLNTLASVHSRRSYAYAIDRFIAWYCGEPRLTFNRAVVVRYRSHLESLSLSAATINLRLSAIRRLADESAESGWLTPELAIGIRRVQGVKRLGRKSGNWLTRNQAQELVNAASKTDLRGWRDGAILGLLLGCGLRRSEVVGLTMDQLQTGGTVGHRGFNRQRKTAANSPGTVVVQAAPGCVAPAFGGERRERVQKSFEIRKGTRGRRHRERSLVCGQTLCPAGGYSTSGAVRSSTHLRQTLPRLQWRIRTDTVSARARFCPDNGAIHREQTEATGCS
jgi:integrase